MPFANAKYRRGRLNTDFFILATLNIFRVVDFFDSTCNYLTFFVSILKEILRIRSQYGHKLKKMAG